MQISTIQIAELVTVWAGYAILVLLLGFATARQGSFEDYSVGQRSFGSLALALSIGATFIGPGFTIGLIGKQFQFGPAYLAVPLGYVFYLLIFGFWVGPLIRRRFNTAVSLTDIFVDFYGPLARPLVGLMSLLLMIGFSAVMLKAIQSVGAITFGNNGFYSMVVVGAATAVYTVTGGFRSTVWTDIFQLVVFVSGFALLALAFHNNPVTLPAPTFDRLSLSATISGFVGFLLGEMFLPPYVVRNLAAKSPSSAGQAYLLASIIGIGWFLLMGYLGYTARQILQSSADADQVAYRLFQVAYGNSGMIVASAALLAIIMSSLSALLNSGATAATKDIYAIRDDTGAITSRSAKIVTALIFAAAVLLATLLPSILDGLLLVYSVWAPAIVPAFLFGIIGLRSQAFGLLGMVTGFSVALFLAVESPPISAAIPPILTSLVASLLILAIGLLFQRSTRRGSK